MIAFDMPLKTDSMTFKNYAEAGNGASLTMPLILHFDIDEVVCSSPWGSRLPSFPPNSKQNC